MPSNPIIGSGSNALVLNISQDAYQGDAQYTVSIDGVPVDGVLTAAALHSLGQDDTVTVLGNFSSGRHTVAVTFLNDAWGGTPDTDRNLYVDGVSFEGQTLANSTAALFSAGTQDVGSFRGAVPVTQTIGSGPDALVLNISQDAYQGDAQYTVSIDGVAVDGVLTASALHSLGQDDTVTVLGDFSSGQHTVSATFLNDAWGGTPDTDRNLYVDFASFEGKSLTNSTAALFSAGTQDLGSFSEAVPVTQTIGSGPDALVLKVSQDDWLGNAQYRISVDGAQLDGILTASAERQLGQDDTITINRSFGAGPHTVTVSFLNDAWGGTPETDRNLFVDGISFNGTALPDSTFSLFTEDSQSVGFNAPWPALGESYMLFSQRSLAPGTRDLWQPQGQVGGTDGSVQGLVDGQPAVVPLSAFDAFSGVEHIDPSWSLFGYASDAWGPTGTQLSAMLRKLQQETAEPGSFQTGAVLDGPAGTPENPYVTVRESAETLFTDTAISLTDADWGGIRNIELLEIQPPSFDQISVRNFQDVRLKFVETAEANTGAIAQVSNAKRGEVDASAVQGTLRLVLGLTSDGPQGDNTFTIKGSARGNDFLAVVPGVWGAGGTTETRLDHLTSLLNDGSASKVVVGLGAGHSVLDASRTHASLEVSGGPDSASSVTPSYYIALAEADGPGTAVFGGQVVRANVFYPGLTLGEDVPVTVTTAVGPVAATGHAIMATRPGALTPEVALALDPHVSFTAVRVDGSNPPDIVPTGSGIGIAEADFKLPTLFPPEFLQGGISDAGDGALILASQGTDTIHYQPGAEGAVAVQGFDRTMDHIVLDGVAAADVRIYDFSGATLIVFQDLAPGMALHSMVYLPGVNGLSLGHEIIVA